MVDKFSWPNKWKHYFYYGVEFGNFLKENLALYYYYYYYYDWQHLLK